MNYKEEYYKLIENQTFYHLPDQQIINFDERVALAVIKNYMNRVLHEEWQYDSYDRYTEIKFNEILYMYKNNKSFWEKTNIKHLILQEGFREQFPEISFQFLSDKDFLLTLNKKNSIVLDSLNKLVLPEEFEKLEKSYLLSKGYGNLEEITKYEDDKEFIIEMIKNDSSLYPKLSENIKNNNEFISVYLTHEQSILNFPKEKQNELFVSWARLHKNWNMKVIDQLDYEYLKPIMKKINKTNNEYLMDKLLSRNINKYKEVIIDFFEQNKNVGYFFKMIREKSLDDLKPVLQDLDCSTYLQKWLNNFNYKKIDKFENKILNIMQRYPNLKTQWEDSFDCMIAKIVSNNELLTFEQFRLGLDIQLQKLEKNLITYEQVESNMIQLKKYLPIELLKENKIPNKCIVEYLQNIKFNEKFEPKGNKERKIKI